jgi:hypothetical protein
MAGRNAQGSEQMSLARAATPMNTTGSARSL